MAERQRRERETKLYLVTVEVKGFVEQSSAPQLHSYDVSYEDPLTYIIVDPKGCMCHNKLQVAWQRLKKTHKICQRFIMTYYIKGPECLTW